MSLLSVSYLQTVQHLAPYDVMQLLIQVLQEDDTRLA